MAAETQYIANTGMVTISTANSSLTGSGTLGTVLTAGANGTKVKSITIKAKGSTTAEGMVRLFVYDGSNNRLFAEIDIPIVTQTAHDPCFEKYMEIDLDLEAGYELRASTQVADAFNIIAEGLDWSYYGGDVRPESTNYFANTGVNEITTANSNLDGSGSVATIITAGSATNYKGCIISSIVIKGTGSTTADGMIRLFIQNTASTVTTLMTEIPVPIVTQTGTARSFAHQIDFPGGFNLQAGYKIIASTEKSNTFIITAEGNDWNYPVSNGNSVSNYTPASVSSVTTEELIMSLYIPPNTLTAGSLLNVYAELIVSTGNNKTFRLYVNTSASLSGATKIATYISTAVSADHISRYIPIIDDTTMGCYAGASGNIKNQYSSTIGTTANVTVPSVSAGFYLIISGQKTNVGDTATVQWFMANKVF